jgi:hypothetical protein
LDQVSVFWLVVVVIGAALAVTGVVIVAAWKVCAAAGRAQKELTDTVVQQFERMTDRCLSTVDDYENVRHSEANNRRDEPNHPSVIPEPPLGRPFTMHPDTIGDTSPG